MTQKVGRGGTIVLDVNFIDGAGVLVDADPVTLDITDPDDIEVVSNASPTTNPSVGVYTYTYGVPGDADLGIWHIKWSGVVNGSAVSGPGDDGEPFEVVVAGSVTTAAQTFATVAELQSHLGLGTIDETKAELALQSATAIIQAEAQHRIFYYADDEKVLRGTYGFDLYLPEPPVFDVSAITVGTTELASSAYTFASYGALRGGPFLSDEEPTWLWGGPQVPVTVTYSHGYEVIPEDIKAVCLSLAGRLFDNPSGAVAETIGSYSYRNATEGSGVLTDFERSICRRYRPVVR